MGNDGKFLNSNQQTMYIGIFEPSVTRRSPQKQKSAQNNSDIGTKRVNQKVFDYLTNSILDKNHI